MSETLDIKRVKQTNQSDLLLKGRLDAFGARVLQEELDELIKEGQFKVCLNFKEVAFLSSAGIRILIKYFKELKGIGGFLKFTDLSDKISEVVNLAGLKHLFDSKQEVKTTKNEKQEVLEKTTESGIFKVLKKEEKKLKARVTGNPKLLESGFTASDTRVEEITKTTYGLGLGAIGDNFKDTHKRFGEFMALQNTAIYLPTDGSKSVDFMVKSNQLIPKVVSLYNLLFEGEFGTFLNFEHKENHTSIPLSELASTLFQIQEAKMLGMVMLSETSGLCGCSLSTPPSGEQSLFSYPSIKENLNFTTEPEYGGSLTLTVGILHQNNADLMAYTRPLLNTDLWGHFHTAVFDFSPIQKDNSNLSDIVTQLLENNRIHNFLHLLNDNRSHNGIGESGFKRGCCWVGSIDELKNTAN